MSGRYFVVVEPNGDSFAFESLAEAKRCEDAWDRDFYRSKPNRIVECVAMPKVTVERVKLDGGQVYFTVVVNGDAFGAPFGSESLARAAARDLRRSLRKKRKVKP